MLKLKWLRVNKFRSVKPGTLLTFSPRYNVLLGQNGTGKTTLLNLVSAAVRLDFSEFEKEEFDIEYELATDKASMHTSVQNAHQSDPIQEAIVLIPGAMLNAAALSLGYDRKYMFTSKLQLTSEFCASPIQITYSEDKLRTEFQDRTYSSTWSSSRPMGGGSVLASLAKLNHQRYIDDKCFFELISLFTTLKNRRFDESLNYLQIIQTARYAFRRFSGVLSVSAPEFPITHEALQIIDKHWGSQYYEFDKQQVPFLGKLSRLLGFDKIKVTYELHEVSTKGDEVLLVLNGPRFFFHGNDQIIIDEQLSYGQKRMLAFMYYSSMAEKIVIADELVNGLHHQWIRACIEEIGERQAFLTSQNPILLDYLTFDSPEQVRSTFILCSRDEQSNQLTWQNMSQDAAEDFYDSYKVGFQHVGELLQSKGLW